jgi:DNA-binding CsgD family transcriptional regulator
MELSEHTVRVYLRRAMKKLNAVTQTEAAVIAVRRPLL